MVMKCDKLEPWKEFILQLIDGKTDLFFAKNIEGASAKTIDAKRKFGVWQMIEEMNAKKNAELESKETQRKANIDSLREPSLKKSHKSHSEDPSLKEENKSPSKSGERKMNKRDSRK